VAADKAASDKVVADAKAAADKVIADAKAAADRAAVQATQDAKKLTITCKKGSSTKKITGESPVCPSGYTNSLAKFLTFQAYSKCKLYQKDSSFSAIALLDAGKTL
jgi:membrane protein involved in colicin uptake